MYRVLTEGSINRHTGKTPKNFIHQNKVSSSKIKIAKVNIKKEVLTPKMDYKTVFKEPKMHKVKGKVLI